MLKANDKTDTKIIKFCTLFHLDEFPRIFLTAHKFIFICTSPSSKYTLTLWMSKYLGV